MLKDGRSVVELLIPRGNIDLVNGDEALAYSPLLHVQMILNLEPDAEFS